MGRLVVVYEHVLFGGEVQYAHNPPEITVNEKAKPSLTNLFKVLSEDVFRRLVYAW